MALKCTAFISSVVYLLVTLAATAYSQNQDTFLCHTCSYSSNLNTNIIACLNDTASLPPYKNIKCGNFCTIEETWDKHKREINSVFRTCSTDWGNYCSEGNTFITCRGSCKGDLCNNHTVADKIDTLCQKFSCDSGSQTVHHATMMSVYGAVLIPYYLLYYLKMTFT